MQLRFIHKKPKVKRVRPDMRNLNVVETRNSKKEETTVSVFPKTEDIKPEPIKVEDVIEPKVEIEEQEPKKNKTTKKTSTKKTKKEETPEEEK